MNPQRIDEITTVFSHSPDGLILADGEGRILTLNPSFRSVTGLQERSVLGRNVEELVQRGLLSDSAIARAVHTGLTSSVKVKTNERTEKQMLSTARPIMDDNRSLIRIVCSVRDWAFLRETDLSGCQADQTALKEELCIIANSSKMLDLLSLAGDLAQVDSNLLILGETGVGKDFVARYIYQNSHRAKTGSFVKVNCAAVPSGLFESELFGYERGAFTGACDRGKPGLIEMAEKGVLFLDEIGDLPLEQQAKLLNVIEDGELIRVGGTTARQVDVRILSATHRDLGELVAQGRFREDLYYRIAVIPLYVPALRERHEDIQPLLQHFQEVMSNRHRRRRVLSEELCQFLSAYSWPGNVRELSNLVERLVVTAKHEVVDLPDLTGTLVPSGLRAARERRFPALSESKSLKELLDEYQLDVVRQAIEMTSSYAEAARLLKTSLSTINRQARRLKELEPSCREPTVIN